MKKLIVFCSSLILVLSTSVAFAGQKQDKGQNGKGQHSKVQQNKVQHNKVQHNKVQHNKVQQNRVQHNKGRHEAPRQPITASHQDRGGQHNRGQHYRGHHNSGDRHHARRPGHHYSRHNDRYWTQPVFSVHHRYQHHIVHRPSYLGAVLLGSALTFRLFHTHHGAVCYDHHDRYDTRSYSSDYYSGGSYRDDDFSDDYDNEVVGCHRIEQLEDGSERRVEVPLSQCN